MPLCLEMTITLTVGSQVDATLPPVPWREAPQPKRLGVIKGFSVVLEPCATAVRALLQVGCCIA